MHRRVGGPPEPGGLAPQRQIPVATQAREHGPLYFTTGQGPPSALRMRSAGIPPAARPADQPPHAPTHAPTHPRTHPTAAWLRPHLQTPGTTRLPGLGGDPDAQSGRCKGTRAGVGRGEGCQTRRPSPPGCGQGAGWVQPGGLGGASLAARGRPPLVRRPDPGGPRPGRRDWPAPSPGAAAAKPGWCGRGRASAL